MFSTWKPARDDPARFRSSEVPGLNPRTCREFRAHVRWLEVWEAWYARFAGTTSGLEEKGMWCAASMHKLRGPSQGPDSLCVYHNPVLPVGGEFLDAFVWFRDSLSGPGCELPQAHLCGYCSISR